MLIGRSKARKLAYSTSLGGMPSTGTGTTTQPPADTSYFLELLISQCPHLHHFLTFSILIIIQLFFTYPHFLCPPSLLLIYSVSLQLSPCSHWLTSCAPCSHWLTYVPPPPPLFISQRLTLCPWFPLASFLLPSPTEHRQKTFLI